jgi:hypothetical protein
MVGLVHKISDYYFLLEAAFIKKIKEKVNSVFLFFKTKIERQKSFVENQMFEQAEMTDDTGTK